MGSCALYPLFSLDGALRIWQINFCENQLRYATCARYQLASKGRSVPLTLLPNGKSFGE